MQSMADIGSPVSGASVGTIGSSVGVGVPLHATKSMLNNRAKEKIVRNLLFIFLLQKWTY
jgi:hypothetical protein